MDQLNIKAIIGLGNPGPQFNATRHNIGFMVVDQLAKNYGASWQSQNNMQVTTIIINDKSILLIKPQTFMNNSGEVIPWLHKKGIKAENILVVHDELELPVGKLKIKHGGSARGHNGVKSLIQYAGDQLTRLNIGIDRPEQRDHVSDYVLQRFSESSAQIQEIIDKACEEIIKLIL